MSFHLLFGLHKPDTKASHWERGYFVTQCTVCGREMVKLPGLDWRVRSGKE
jgi:hypothetical protein